MVNNFIALENSSFQQYLFNFSQVSSTVQPTYQHHIDRDPIGTKSGPRQKLHDLIRRQRSDLELVHSSESAGSASNTGGPENDRSAQHGAASSPALYRRTVYPDSSAEMEKAYRDENTDVRMHKDKENASLKLSSRLKLSSSSLGYETMSSSL